jgi:hypothetical protein
MPIITMTGASRSCDASARHRGYRTPALDLGALTLATATSTATGVARLACAGRGDDCDRGGDKEDCA